MRRTSTATRSRSTPSTSMSALLESPRMTTCRSTSSEDACDCPVGPVRPRRALGLPIAAGPRRRLCRWWLSSLAQIAPREVPHQRSRTEGPGRDAIAAIDAVYQGAERWRRHGHDVADRVGESLARTESILRGREHRAQKEHQAIGILMVGADRLPHQVERVATDHCHRATALECEAVRAVDAHRQFAAAHGIDGERIIEQPNEWTDCAGPVVVLGLAEKKRAAA